MRIGIIGPSKLREKDKISRIAKIVANLGKEIVLTPDKGSSSEFFAQEYLANKGKKVFEIVPLDDKEFGYDWVNLDLGEKINCGSWRNQPEKLNEESDVLLCLGYSTGGMIEICYSKWFKKKPVYIINEFIEDKLPKELEESLDLKYISIEDLEKELK
ncbi:hypothetical protein GOV13_03690 [Candidatus Pacearchaeota archaeon]|nr:hypothetical protein [Candidatus Pacearchaeota archaeon]